MSIKKLYGLFDISIEFFVLFLDCAFIKFLGLLFALDLIGAIQVRIIKAI